MRVRVTTKNAAAVMGKINTFLRKETKEYVGLRQHKVGIKEESFGDETFKMPIYEERETFVPLMARCEEHHIHKEIREKIKKGERLFHDDMHQYNRVLLAISDKYRTNCIPILAGYEVSITGDKMTIKENDVCYELVGFDGKVTRMKNKDKSSYSTFYHMPFSEEERMSKIKEGVSAMFDVCNQIYYCVDLYDMDYPDWIKSSIRSLHSDLTRSVCDILDADDFDLTKDEIIETLYYDADYCESKKEVKVHINLAAIRNGIENAGKEAFFFTCGDEVFDDLYPLIENGLLGDEIKEYYDRVKESGDCDDYCDYDYDFDDYDFD